MRANLLLTAALLMSSAMPIYADAGTSTTDVIAINVGGRASGNFVADQDLTSGQTYTTVHTAAVSTTNVSNPPPQAVYQDLRYGKDFTYTIPSLTPNATYTVRLDMDEPFWTQANQRVFDVTINGKQVLTNFDIFKSAGGTYKAIAESFPTTANATGQIVINFKASVNEAIIAGIEIQGSAAGGPGGGSGGNTETPESADHFVDSVGMDTHFYTAGTVYADNFSKVASELVGLGIRHIRDGGSGLPNAYYQHLITLGQQGIHSDAGTQPKANASEDLAQLKQMIADMPYMESIEPQNEPDDGQKTDAWVAPVVAWQKTLYGMVKELNPNIAVMASPMGYTANASKLGDLSAYMNHGNIHSSPGGGNNPGKANPPYATAIAEEKTNSGSNSIWVTETGYNDQLTGTTFGNHIPSNVIATYLPRDYMAWKIAGADRMYQYQFANEPTDKEFGGEGLIDQNGNPKPQYFALQSMLQLLTEKGAAFTPKPITLTFGGNVANVQHYVFEKSDGSYYVAIWIEQPCWKYENLNSGYNIPVAPQSITLKPNFSPSTAIAYTYSTSSCLKDSNSDWSLHPASLKIGEGNVISLNATDTVTFLKIK